MLHGALAFAADGEVEREESLSRSIHMFRHWQIAGISNAIADHGSSRTDNRDPAHKDGLAKGNMPFSLALEDDTQEQDEIIEKALSQFLSTKMHHALMVWHTKVKVARTADRIAPPSTHASSEGLWPFVNGVERRLNSHGDEMTPYAMQRLCLSVVSESHLRKWKQRVRKRLKRCI